ncbi:hypothetical protein [Providencia huaxiensis]|uniref:hypothetical protein n=1 Tax=Providencia huaxiensis TaxID=2027290 RepID=UPI000C7F4F1A|nr:hypothetical protein [Providencia huaxiensis]AXH60537.1 hypothetical protein CYG50_00100 [Providencia huaxiensis]
MEEKQDLQDTIKALKALEGNAELRGYAMGQLLESYMDIEETFKKISNTVDEKIQAQIEESINALSEKVTLIRDTIKELPSDLDQQVASMLNVVQTSHDTTMADINLLQERVNIANGMALSTISEAMLNASHAFEKSLIESKNKVFDEAIKELHNVTEKYSKEHDEISRKLSTENASTNRQMAWVIIGATLVINIVGVVSAYLFN